MVFKMLLAFTITTINFNPRNVLYTAKGEKMNMYEELLGQLNPDGSVKKEAYDLLRNLGPMPCVDVVLVPREKSQRVILHLRGSGIVAPNQYWVIGGRVSKGEKLEETARRKVKSEAGLDLLITKNDQLFASETIFDKDGSMHYNGESNDRLVDLIHTTNVVYLELTPSLDEIGNVLTAADGNTKWKVFDQIDENWHPYVQECVERAWKRVFS